MVSSGWRCLRARLVLGRGLHFCFTHFGTVYKLISTWALSYSNEGVTGREEGRMEEGREGE